MKEAIEKPKIEKPKIEKTKIEKLIEGGTPFAVARYHFSFKVSRSEGGFIHKYLFLRKGHLKEIGVDSASLEYLKNNAQLFKVIITEGGKVYDFNNFRSYFRKNATRNEMKKIKNG